MAVLQQPAPDAPCHSFLQILLPLKYHVLHDDLLGKESWQ